MMWHADNYEEIRKQLVLTFETAADSQCFWRMTAKDCYLKWMSERLETYQNYMNQEGDRTNRFPVTLAKNFLALLREHGNVSLANDVREMIKRYS